MPPRLDKLLTYLPLRNRAGSEDRRGAEKGSGAGRYTWFFLLRLLYFSNLKHLYAPHVDVATTVVNGELCVVYCTTTFFLNFDFCFFEPLRCTTLHPFATKTLATVSTKTNI